MQQRSLNRPWQHASPHGFPVKPAFERIYALISQRHSFHLCMLSGRRRRILVANFTQTQNVKSAERNNTAPIVDVTTFGTVLSDLVTSKPGADSAEIATQSYTVKFRINDAELNKLGEVTVKVPATAAYTQAITEIVTNGVLDAVATACGAGSTIERDQSDDVFSARVKLTQTEENGDEIFYVTLSREKTRITSYEADAVLTAVETWADTQTVLA